MKKCTLSLFSLALLAGTIAANGATVTTSVMDANVEGSLLKIIAEAPDNTQVDIDFNFDGTTLTYAEASAVKFINKKISINGTNAFNGKNVIITSPLRDIDGDGVAKESSSLFNVSEGSTLTLKNLEITGCQKIATFCEKDGVLNVDNCKIYKNIDMVKEKGNNGGFLRQSGGTVTITNSVFSENEAYGSYGGGAICTYTTTAVPCSLTVSNCSFIFNQSTSGGAICVNVRDYDIVPTVKIENCTFADNNCGNRGGAIYMQDAHKAAKNPAAFVPVLVNNTFVGNITNIVTSPDGGALNFWARDTSVHMTPIMFNCLFAGNYYDPWDKDVLNDIKLFYFARQDEDGTQHDATVEMQVSNNIYGAPLDEFYVNLGKTNNSYLYDFSQDKIFEGIELNRIEDGDEEGTHMTAKLVGDRMVAALCKESVAIGKGVASFAGVTAPATDEAGNARPAVPSIGAAEYSATGSAESAIADNGITLVKEGKLLVVNGATDVTVNVYDTLGNLVLSKVCNEGINVNELGAGLYIAKAQNVTLKFTK